MNEELNVGPLMNKIVVNEEFLSKLVRATCINLHKFLCLGSNLDESKLLETYFPNLELNEK